MTTYEPGSVIAGYRIDSLIGRGGMAVVYRAEDMRLGRKVALKLLTPQLADNEQFRQRFIQESRVAASLDHPNIVPIYEAGEADGQLYIAMRYVVGHDLKGLLADQGGRLPLEWALRLFGQIGDALDSAHRAGLVHRDVKPANILVAESQERPGDVRGDHAYLTDFGLTKRTTEVSSGLTGTGHFLGTVDYVSPEQIQGKPVGPGTDIYALGCVLYECLTGLPPFRRDDDAALLWAHLVETPPPIAGIRPEIPQAVSAVVARAMAKDPADRYGSCEELVCELESALDVPTPVTALGGQRTQDSGAATRGADATSDGLLSEVGTVAEDVPGGSRHLFVRFPAPADALYETVPSANYQPDLEKYPEPEREHDAGSASDQREPVTDSVPLSVAGDRSPDVAAAAATPSVSTERPQPSGSLRRRPAVWLIIVGLLALALGVAAVGANLLDSVDATSVVAEPADTSGGDPFTPPPTPDGAASESAPAAGGGSAPDSEGGAPTEDVPVSGDTVGLYGGTGAEACSAASMATFFDTHPDRAAAWARAQGIQPSDIRSFLSSLTPVVLRTDTAVTNHGFRDGRANAYQAVLQAGTAVMVDEHGVPRVRCACGNPLDRPAARQQVRYTGQTWPELGRRPVTIVQPAPVIVEHFVVLVVEQDTTVVVERLRGSDGDHDKPAAPEVVEAAMAFSVEDPVNAESGDEPATDGSNGTGDQAATDGSAGAGDQAATDGSAGSGGEPATDGSAGSGGEPATDGSAGTGEQPATDGSARAGEQAAAGSSPGRVTVDLG
jgi:serine/threonine protein kinase